VYNTAVRKMHSRKYILRHSTTLDTLKLYAKSCTDHKQSEINRHDMSTKSSQ